jgi:hypothetical protein
MNKTIWSGMDSRTTTGDRWTENIIQEFEMAGGEPTYRRETDSVRKSMILENNLTPTGFRIFSCSNEKKNSHSQSKGSKKEGKNTHIRLTYLRLRQQAFYRRLQIRLWKAL